jgi:hypothetical protein
MAHVNPEQILSNVVKRVPYSRSAESMGNGMMGNMMGEGMMEPMMRGMMGDGMMMGGMNMADTAPKARRLMAGVAAGTAASASSVRMSFVARVLRNPYVVVGLGIVTGYLIHKYRNEIIQAVRREDRQAPALEVE